MYNSLSYLQARLAVGSMLNWFAGVRRSWALDFVINTCFFNVLIFLRDVPLCLYSCLEMDSPMFLLQKKRRVVFLNRSSYLKVIKTRMKITTSHGQNSKYRIANKASLLGMLLRKLLLCLSISLCRSKPRFWWDCSFCHLWGPLSEKNILKLYIQNQLQERIFI